MLIKVLVLKLVETMLLYSGVGGEIGSGDGEVVELEVVTEVSFGCVRISNKGAKSVKGGGHVGVGGSVGVCFGRCVDTSACFVIGGAYVILYFTLMVDLILVNLISLLWFELCQTFGFHLYMNQ